MSKYKIGDQVKMVSGVHSAGWLKKTAIVKDLLQQETISPALTITYNGIDLFVYENEVEKVEGE